METIFDKPLNKQVADNTQAIANLDEKITDYFIQHSSSATHTFTLAGNGACLLAVATNGGSRCWVGYVFRASSSGNITIYEMAKGSNATASTSGGTLTITFDTAVPVFARVMYIYGEKLQ